jgi:hypothetical protein
MRTFTPFVVLAAGLIASSTALAQATPAASRPCVAASGASDPGADCMGPRGGMRGGMGPRARYGSDFTPGWGMMSREERQQHRDKMLSFSDYEQCKVYAEQHHGQMTERAKERGRTAPAQSRRDPCAALKPPAAKK